MEALVCGQWGLRTRKTQPRRGQCWKEGGRVNRTNISGLTNLRSAAAALSWIFAPEVFVSAAVRHHCNLILLSLHCPNHCQPNNGAARRLLPFPPPSPRSLPTQQGCQTPFLSFLLSLTPFPSPIHRQPNYRVARRLLPFPSPQPLPTQQQSCQTPAPFPSPSPSPSPDHCQPNNGAARLLFSPSSSLSLPFPLPHSSPTQQEGCQTPVSLSLPPTRQPNNSVARRLVSSVYNRSQRCRETAFTAL